MQRMSVIVYYGNLKILIETLANTIPKPSWMETKNEIKIMEKTIKKNGAHIKEKKKKKKSNKVVDI